MAVMCLTASAQNHRRDGGAITVQPMVGLSVGTWRGETSGTTSTSNNARVGLAIGAEGEYYTNTDWLSISAAVKYEMLGWKFKDTDAAKLDYINIPILANFYVAKGFALKVGVQPGFLVKAKQGSVDFKDQCKTFNFAIPVGLSYEFANGITPGLRGGYSLTGVGKDWGSDFKGYCDCGSLTIGYKFSVK